MSAYVIEAQLLRWSESHNGRTVTLQLPADGDHPFRGLPCGPAHGQRLALSVALISDDESTKALEPGSEGYRSERPPLEPTPQAPEKPAGGGNGKGADKHRLSRQAALCCQDARFRAFLAETYDYGRPLTGPEDAASAVRHLCSVESRAEFDTDTNAAGRWNALHAQFLAESA